jgi:ketosteroid isomerase-like protein
MSGELPPSQVRRVLAQEQAWAAAHRQFDRDALEAILSESFMKLDAEGRIIDKDMLLEGYDPENRSWQVAESSDHQVTIVGDTALAFGRWRGKGMNHGVAFDYEAHFLAVYVLEDGSWRMLSEHSVPIDGAASASPEPAGG